MAGVEVIIKCNSESDAIDLAEFLEKLIPPYLVGFPGSELKWSKGSWHIQQEFDDDE